MPEHSKLSPDDADVIECRGGRFTITYRTEISCHTKPSLLVHFVGRPSPARSDLYDSREWLKNCSIPPMSLDPLLPYT